MTGAFLAVALGAALLLGEPPDSSRIVALGGAVTETVAALGAADRLVGVDDSSTFPPEIARLPKVGFHRTFSAEGVISLAPTLVLMTEESGPPAAVEQLRSAGIAAVVRLDAEHSAAGAARRIRAVARALGVAARGEDVVRAMETDLAAARAAAAALDRPPRVLFLYAHGPGTLLVSGRDTAADAMIRLAGGVNAVTAYAGYDPLTAEAAIAAAPDVILVTEAGLASAGGKERLCAHPALALTPAGRTGRVVAFGALALLGFGPRTGRSALDLARALGSGDAAELSPATSAARVPGGDRR